MQITKNNVLKIAIIAGLFLIAGSLALKYSKTNLHNQPSSTKQQRWDAMAHEVDTWADGMGMPIDPGIKKAVLVLNLLNFKTDQSCEGHIDWGLPYPWIRFSIEDEKVEALNNELTLINNQMDEKESEVEKKYPHLSRIERWQKEDPTGINEMYSKRNSLVQERDEIAKIARLEMVPLNNLIADFYKNKSIDPDRMLVVHELGAGWFELSSSGGNSQDTRNENEKLKKLKEYQQEMQLFTDFLTDYYFTH